MASLFVSLTLTSTTALAANGTLTFTSNTGITGTVAQDGQGGSTDLAGITIQISNITDTAGTIDGDITWQNTSFYGSGAYTALTYDDGVGGGRKGMSIKSSDASEFQINSFQYLNWGESSTTTITVKGYRDGSEVASVDFEGYDVGYNPTTVSLNSTFDNVDQVRLYISAGGHIGDQSASYHSINNIVFADAVLPPPTITSSTYNAATGALAVTGTNFTATAGATNDVAANKFTLTGEGGATYTLTDTADVEILSATNFTLALSATDRAGVNVMTNKNGTSSTGGTSYNLAGAAGFIANAAATPDLTGNTITVSNVPLPTISNAAYNAGTGALTVAGSGFTRRAGATNDIVANKFTLYGEGGSNYTLTDTSNVEITSGTSFTLTLSATDKAAYNLIANKNGGSSTDISTYYFDAADDWAAGADATLNVEDASGNNITVSNVAIPTITSATYNFSTGVLVVTGSGYLSSAGATNDVVANTLTLTGQAGGTYTLTDTANVEVSSGTSFTLTLSATDKTGVNNLVNQNGLTAQDSTTYNLAAADNWAAGANAALNVADLTGNAITASNVVTVPGAPTIGTATAGDTQASITFSAPGSNGGSAITSYTVTSNPGTFTGTGAGSPIVVTGLSNATAYTFTVTATNGVGTGSASGASNSITPKAAQSITFANPGAQNFGTTPTLSATSSSSLVPTFTSSTTGVCTITSGGALTFVTAGSCIIDADEAGNASYLAAPTVSRTFTVNAVVPGAPTAATATAGDTQASVSFTAPTFTGGVASTGYTVTSNPGGLTGTGAASPIAVTGLTNGVAYTFTVTATNSAGTGTASAASSAITPAAAQTITFANPGAQNFGTTPTLSATADSGLTPVFTSATTGVCTITSGGALTFVTAGTCTINANEAGNGSYLAAATVARSFSVNAVVPGAPTAATATAGDTQASVAFSAPAFTGGAAITGYTVTSSPGGLTGAGVASPLTVTGLTNGVAYSFTVTATNSAGTGTASAATSSATPKATQTITFANPGAQNFGTAPTLSATADSGLTPIFTSATTGVCTITSGGQLTTVTAGTCTINANEAGDGTYLAAAQVSRSFSINAIVPTAPTAANALAGDAQATVSFTAPAFTGGAAITGYTVTSNPGAITASGSGSPITVSGLTNGTAYTFTVTATNSVGSSGASAASNSVTPQVPNSAPTISGSPATSVAQDTAYSFTPLANDADTGTTLTFSISNQPAWATFDTTSGTLAGTPTKSAVGNYPAIVISVSDGSLSAALPAFNIEVTNVNDAPTISGAPATTVAQNATYSFTPTASDLDAGTTLTFSISNQPAWANFNTATGMLSGTPSQSDVGSYAGIVISVSDGILSASLPAFNIDVTNVNDTPTISGTPMTLVAQGVAYSFVPTASDPDTGSTLSFTISNKPAWATFDSATGALTGTPKRVDVGTTQGIVISVSDGELSASLAAFNLEVFSTNSAPTAIDDNLTVPFSLNNSYQLNVLANDSDPEQDALVVTAANSSAGQVSIVDNQLLLNAPANFHGSVNLTYSVTDGEFSTQANVSLLISGSNPDAPKITVPSDIRINATGLSTKVDVGVATAVDALGNRIAVNLDNGLPVFSPGKHQLYWRATDSKGVTSVASQLLEIMPLISLSKSKVSANHTSATVDILLNGPSPVYPIDVAYSVSGSATPLADHDLTSGVLEISSGTSATINIKVFADLVTTAEKDLVVTLTGDGNLGSDRSTRILITDRNLPPTVALTATQQSTTGGLFSITAGAIVVDAQVVDANTADTVTLQWLTDPALINIATDPAKFEFDPASLVPGVYKVALQATDNANEPLSVTKELLLRVVKDLPVLGSGDSNNNLIPDNVEGAGDNNRNGIPNYLDNMPSSNILPQIGIVTNAYLLECDPGVRCGLGLFALGGQSGGVQILNSELGGSNQVPQDESFTPVGGIFDFVIDELPTPGQQVSIVIPQIEPIPRAGSYRKFQKGRWVSFIENANNRLASAQGSAGYCPPPGAAEWQPGLIEGYHCVQLTIEDGGPNDDDGLVNSAVSDPGSVMVPRSNNQLPKATADTYSLQWNQAHQLRVLDNDSDTDGDALSIYQASAAFGQVTVSTDGQSLWYTPNNDFIGSDVVNYIVRDGKGGNATATATITVYYNRAPVVKDSATSTNDRTEIDIAALTGASDADGDTLSIVSATAQKGAVSIINGQTLRYTPVAGFHGSDIISFNVSDARGGLVSAKVTVTVTAFEVITVENKSSGGAMSGWPLALLTLLVACRQRRTLSTALLALTASLSFSAQATWSVDGFYGQSKVKQSRNDIGGSLPANTVIVDYDDSGRSWALGGNYHFNPALAVQIQYVDLGDASVTLRADTLTPDQFYQAVSTVGPMQANGIRSGVSYQFWQHSDWSFGVQGGVFVWESSSSSARLNEVIHYSANATDFYWGLSGSYLLDPRLSLQTSFTRYQLDTNKVDALMVGINYRF
ncbi:MAG: tandem-95 repeat protein [Gammaproteobacteria bacterium]|nr:tandem-95 repeat protein [Gammaproteobacteria bacterium]